MAVETVQLSGDALTGVAPELIPRRLYDSDRDTPALVCLGARKPPARPACLRFAPFFKPDRASAPIPPAVNYRDKAAASLGRMYLNDRFGCCVISGKAHALGVWSGNDSDSPGLILASDQEILEQYRGVCGPGDNGCYVTQVLDYCRDRGFLAGGVRHKIDGYLSCDWTDRDEVRAVQYLFGATTIAFNLPASWTSSAVWDVTSSRTIGGHDVTPLGYDEQGVYVSSWGRVYLMTWPAFCSRRYIDEYYAMLAPAWYGSDKMSPAGLDVTGLRAALEIIRGGGIPPIPDPVTPPGPPPSPPPGPPPGPPPIPPVPPAPPAPTSFRIELTGTNGTQKVRLGGTAVPIQPGEEPDAG